MIDLLILSGLVLSLTQLLKVTFGMNTRFAPLASLLISVGIMISYSFVQNTEITWASIENALIVGFSASGLWSGTKATFSK